MHFVAMYRVLLILGCVSLEFCAINFAFSLAYANSLESAMLHAGIGFIIKKCHIEQKNKLILFIYELKLYVIGFGFLILVYFFIKVYVEGFDPSH